MVMPTGGSQPVSICKSALSVRVLTVTTISTVCHMALQVKGVMALLTKGLQLTEEHLDLMWAVTEKVRCLHTLPLAVIACVSCRLANCIGGCM